MPTSTTTRRQTRTTDESREVMIAAFWDFSSNRNLLKDSERLFQIKAGFSAHLFQAFRMTFDLQERSLETLLNASISTLKRRGREQKPLNSVASERLDRIAAVCHMAEEVFESREAAARWMSKPNKALGEGTPVMLCETEIGAKQVRRVLRALRWGGAA
ncbi:MbcA/ParS/Xre antitoxin family protein [Pseudomonas sp. 6D_7.1_Bac1]|uniref:MbcA/ParS/Xre antitoxin family protein n=1 Tax=Pseudomonas sp. 6D_7.1_Bac1 TaxID=2971615 RepID=UPI0021C92B83|nr:MbcA/ParS/Xre antitoxin family protein [Pseudomonas sp. 6D_7.1_Bac1]MCU1751302.1 MbcA/ParS/Xre antitoxin family protein [Pseudomonas sp. 6D_7.1_Bac1]